MGTSADTRQRMRDDWDRRAREDAEYYVAFGRKSQSAEEFFASAADVLRALRQEFVRFPEGTDLAQLTALEIGCGPGRLMLPLSREFGRVYGVDVSEEMVRLAERNLAGAPNAEPRVASGADLAGFEDESVDFCYSYAVFQHIPDREAVLSYLREAVRVLRPGGLLKFQFNSLPRADRPAFEPVAGWSLRAGAPAGGEALQTPADTWSGCSFSGEELAAFAAAHGLQLLALDGFETQYLWMTARKGRPAVAPDAQLRLAGVANSSTSDGLVPQAGRSSSASFWVENLPEGADLNNLRVDVEGVLAAPSFVGRKARIGSGQVNVYLPPGVRAGMVPVRMLLDGRPASNTVAMRVAPPAPLIARLVEVTDGVNLLSKLSVASRSLKVSIEEAPYDSAEAVRTAFRARLNDCELAEVEAFRVDPMTRRFELNLRVPVGLPPGPYNLFCELGRRRFAPVGLVLEA
jgi:ubiquinone/menaquinone biosynthesis C-methylase UbiE